MSYTSIANAICQWKSATVADDEFHVPLAFSEHRQLAKKLIDKVNVGTSDMGFKCLLHCLIVSRGDLQKLPLKRVFHLPKAGYWE